MKLICSDDEQLVDDYLASVIANVNDYQVVRYESVSQLVDLLSQRSLFNKKSRFVIKKCDFITSTKKTNKTDDLVTLTRLLMHFIDDDIYLTSSDFAKKSVPSILEKFIDKVQITRIPKLNRKIEIKKYVKDYAKSIDLKLDEKTLNYLTNKLVADAGVIVNEINKLFLGSYHDTNLEKARKLLLDYHVMDYSGKNIFRLLHKIIAGDCEGSILMYDQLIAEQYLPSNLLQVMMSQLFVIKNVCRLLQKGLSSETICHGLGLPTYFFVMNRDVYNPHFLKKFITMFNRMCELDIEWKTGLTEPNQCLRASIVWFCGLFSQF